MRISIAVKRAAPMSQVCTYVYYYDNATRTYLHLKIYYIENIIHSQCCFTISCNERVSRSTQSSMGIQYSHRSILWTRMAEYGQLSARQSMRLSGMHMLMFCRLSVWGGPAEPTLLFTSTFFVSGSGGAEPAGRTDPMSNRY